MGPRPKSRSRGAPYQGTPLTRPLRTNHALAATVDTQATAACLIPSVSALSRRSARPRPLRQPHAPRQRRRGLHPHPCGPKDGSFHVPEGRWLRDVRFKRRADRALAEYDGVVEPGHDIVYEYRWQEADGAWSGWRRTPDTSELDYPNEAREIQHRIAAAPG